MRVPLLLIALAFVPAALAQSGEVYMIHMQDYSFLPESLEVPPGAKVYGMNFGPSSPSIPVEDQIHSITSSDGTSFDVQQIQPDGEPREFTAPTTPGSYPYYCRYHGSSDGTGMVGTLVVTQSAGAPTQATPTPTSAATPTKSNDAPLAPIVAIAALALVAFLARRR